MINILIIAICECRIQHDTGGGKKGKAAQGDGRQ